MRPWIAVRVVEPVRPRPIAELVVSSFDPKVPDEAFGSVDEVGDVRILPRSDGTPWEVSLRELSQALWEAEDRLRDLDGT